MNRTKMGTAMTHPMNEDVSTTEPMAPKIFSERYRPAIRCGIIWAFVLALWCSMVLDMGESLHSLLYALGGYLGLVLIVMLRRPKTPIAFDLILSAGNEPHSK
jgi:hypothetical protein